VKYPQWTASKTYDSGETSVADSSGRYYFVYYIFPTGLFFARFKKTQSRKKLAQKKNSRQNFAKKKTQSTGVTSIFHPKNSGFFHYQGPILIDFEAKITFLRNILLKLSKIRLFW